MPVTVPEQRRQTKGVGDCDKKRRNNGMVKNVVERLPSSELKASDSP